jgi:hypothetical protein
MHKTALLFLGLAACGTNAAGSTDETTESGGTETPSTSDVPGSSGPMMTTTTTGSESSTGPGDTDCATDCQASTTSGEPPEQCDFWEQDCPDGHKCMPWADNGGNSWNAYRCSPIADDPAGPGERCVVEESGVSGIDNCDATSLCFDVDADTLEGTCRPFCMGSESEPTCPDACDSCTISATSVLLICLPACDPLAPGCNDGEACQPHNQGFVCMPDTSGESGAPGDICESVNACDPGTVCATAELLPECDGTGCCTPYCTVGDSTPCTALPGTECVPLFEEGPPPEACTSADVGACLTPA